ncbi:MAG: hypothetical protein FRX49_02426 [Trebouxia sp. A1-2]|nr:MAG: hypothetical protein FRX49_02426 [Trebouxia sp. A1-2]
MTSIYSKSDTTGHTQRPPDAPRQTSKKRRHADQSSVPHEPHPSAAMNFIDQHPVVDGSSAPLSGTDLIPEEKKSIKQKKKRTRSASQIVLDSQGINNRPGPQSLQADPQPEHRVLAEGSTEAAKQAASGTEGFGFSTGDAPKRKKRKVGAPTAQQGDLQPSITAPDLPKEPQDSAWEDSFLSRVDLAALPTSLTVPDTDSFCIGKQIAIGTGYIDKCESWLAEAVQGRADAKSVAVHIMVLAHYWEYQVLLHVSNHDSQTASLQQISKIQFRIRGLAKQLQDLLPPSWMPAVAVTAGRLLRGMSLICPVWMRLSSKTALVNGTFQLLHPEDLPHDCATQTVSYLLEALHPAPNDQRFATYLACWSDKTHEAAAAEEPPRDAMASSSSPQMHGRQTQGRELTAQQASAAVELPAANQAAALVEVRTATDAAEASCLNLEEPGLAQPEKVKTGPTSGVAPAKARGKTGTAFPIVQAAPTLSSGQAAIAGTCELPAAAAQAQLSGKPELADSFDLGKSDATAKAMPAQMTNILVQVVPASQGNMLVGQAEGQLAPGQTSLHGQSTLPIAKSVQKPPLAPKFGQRRKQVPDQQRNEASARDPAQQQAEQPVHLPAQQSAQTPVVSHKPAQQPSVAQEPVQERDWQTAEQSPHGPIQKQTEKLKAAEDLTQASAQQPAGPPATGPEQTAAQLNAYLRLDDNGLAYAAAILSKVAPPPYDAAEPWLRRYSCHDVLVRQLLWWRAFWKHGKKDADEALITRDEFVQVCLMGVQPAVAARTNKETGVRHAAQVCKAYLRMLHKMYGDELVMQPYIMSVDALNARDTSGAEALSNFRLLQKRFVVYQPSKAAPHPPSTPGQPQSGPEQIMKTSSCHQPGQDQQAARDGSDSIDVDIMGMQEQDDADSQSALLDWDDALVRLWKKAQQRVGPLTHGEVRDQLDPAAPSCGLQAGTWQAGRCMSEEVGDTVRVQDAIDNSLLNKPQGFPRLHFIDGTFPGELPEGVTCQDDLPGLWCGVDQTANQMFPPALRSDRPDSFFKQMCVESTGAASFTLFAACGPATNITPFHQETKKRRSFNCGTGDFIVQPLCTADNVRQVERVHAAVMGAHERHACLLPLEMYLEEGIPLVCYIRDQGHAQMVELPEQSCHAFMSFSNAAAPPPCIKVSCNDWHVESELSSAYLLEKLLASCREAGVEAEVGEGGADPDTWVETPYALRQPCSLHEQTGEPMCKLGLDGTWQRPWADEMQTQECTEQDVAEQADRGNRCSDVEVLLNALPVLLDMAIRAEPVSSDQASYFSKEYMHRLIYLVQKALSSAGLDTALHKAEAFLADLHATKGSKGNGGSAEDRHTSHMSSEVRRMVKSDQVFGVFMHLQDAVDCKVSCSTTASRKKTAIAGLRHFTEAVEALTQTELLGLSLPTLRSVQI